MSNVSLLVIKQLFGLITADIQEKIFRKFYKPYFFFIDLSKTSDEKAKSFEFFNIQTIRSFCCYHDLHVSSSSPKIVRFNGCSIPDHVFALGAARHLASLNK